MAGSTFDAHCEGLMDLVPDDDFDDFTRVANLLAICVIHIVTQTQTLRVTATFNTPQHHRQLYPTLSSSTLTMEMSSDNVPFFDSLSSIYDSAVLEQQQERYQKLYDKFIELYKTTPSHIVRAPGRVNLIVLRPLKSIDDRANT